MSTVSNHQNPPKKEENKNNSQVGKDVGNNINPKSNTQPKKSVKEVKPDDPFKSGEEINPDRDRKTISNTICRERT